MAALGDFFARIFGSKDKPQLGLTPSELEAEWLVVGLGNPGAKYAATRHNVGYMAIDDLLAAGGDVLEPVRGMDVQVAPLSWAGQKVLAVRSGTFMNLSGDPVAPLAQQLGIAADHVDQAHAVAFEQLHTLHLAADQVAVGRDHRLGEELAGLSVAQQG